VPAKTEEPERFRGLRNWIRMIDDELATDPANPEKLHRKARVYQRLAGAQWCEGEDPTASLLCAIDYASLSVALAGKKASAFTLQVLGDSLTSVAEEQENLGNDPTEWLLCAVAAYDRAISRDRRDPGPWNGRSTAYGLLGEWFSKQGANPAQAFARAIESGDRAVKRCDDVRGHYSRARANLAFAIWLVRCGKDPGKTVDRALELDDLLAQREFNGAEAGFLLARDRYFVRRWSEALLALQEALGAYSDRDKFRALAERVARAARRGDGG
jgi:hypothetical protein